MKSLPELTQEIVAFRDARDWKQFHSLKEMILSLMLESSEVAELFQWKSEQQALESLPDLRHELGRELADVLYWVLLIAHDAGLNIEQSFAEKMAENNRKYPVERARGSSAKYTKL
jgi:dCTP diphosphatase